MMRRYALNALDAARNLGDGVHEHFSDAPDDDNTALQARINVLTQLRDRFSAQMNKQIQKLTVAKEANYERAIVEAGRGGAAAGAPMRFGGATLEEHARQQQAHRRDEL